jgi:putative membrane protein
VRSARRFGLTLGAACLASSLAAAHADQPPTPHDIWTAWSLDPLVLASLFLLVGTYGLGLVRMWRRAGLGHGVPGWRLACFVGSVLALGLALVWPLDALGESLFAAHMGQHMMLMLVAAPLLIIAAPLAPALHALPARWRSVAISPARSGWWQWSGPWLLTPVTATLLQLVALYAWHTPAAIAAALEDDVVHSTMHASLLGAALLFWWTIIRAGRFGYGWGILTLLITAKLSGLLGAVLAFGGVPLYQAYGDRTAPWGLSPLEDQQLAGTLMLSLGGVAYVLTAVVLAAAFLAAMERRHPSHDRL